MKNNTLKIIMLSTAATVAVVAMEQEGLNAGNPNPLQLEEIQQVGDGVRQQRKRGKLIELAREQLPVLDQREAALEDAALDAIGRDAVTDDFYRELVAAVQAGRITRNQMGGILGF